MRIVVLGCLAVAVLSLLFSAVLSDGRTAMGQPAMPNAAAFSAPGLITLSENVQQRYQQLTVIDPRREVISVYHVNLVSGAISLRSVRNIHWDLQMSDYNGSKPLPREIQALLEQR